MKATKNWSKALLAGMAALVLAFGLVLAGCDNGNGGGSGGGVDTALNGTWVADGVELKLDNEKFEFPGDMKGTYTTSGSNVKITVTHIYGDKDGLESKWYAKADLKSLDISDDVLNAIFVTLTETYSVSGNTLTMTMDGETITYTKK
jgi:hypothetical protein